MLSIRTQDRMALVPYDSHIVIRKRSSKHSIEIETYYSTVILGTYATKERALEVLDEIEMVCVGKVLISANPLPNKDHWVYQNKNIVLPKDKDTIEVLPLIYQMPKER